MGTPVNRIGNLFLHEANGRLWKFSAPERPDFPNFPRQLAQKVVRAHRPLSTPLPGVQPTASPTPHATRHQGWRFTGRVDYCISKQYKVYENGCLTRRRLAG